MGDNTSPYTIIVGDDYKSIILFYATFVTSIMSASLGLAKGLLYGVARTISSDGFLDGVFSGRFLVASLQQYLHSASRYGQNDLKIQNQIEVFRIS